MKAANIQDAVERAPFRGFTLELDNGRSLHVPHRDFIFLNPKGTTAVVIEGEHMHIVDVEHVSMIKFDKGNKKVA